MRGVWGTGGDEGYGEVTGIQVVMGNRIGDEVRVEMVM